MWVVTACVVDGWTGANEVTWLEQTLDEISRLPVIGYSVGGHAAAAPTALAALAFLVHGRLNEGKKAATALAEMQQANGEVSVRVGEQTPGWPTSLAVVAWSTT